MASQADEQTAADGRDEAPWDDPNKSDEERWAEYEKRYDLIVLPPRYPDDPQEGEYERIPGSFEVPLGGYPGWRMGFVPKGAIRFHPATGPSPVEKAKVR